MVGVPAVHAGHLHGVYLAVIALVPLAAIELVVNLPVATQALQRTRRAAARVFALTDDRCLSLTQPTRFRSLMFR